MRTRHNFLVYKHKQAIMGNSPQISISSTPHPLRTNTQLYYRQEDMLTPKLAMAFVTVPKKEVGLKLAKSLVSQKLAACVNVKEGVTSIYEWEGKIEEDQELLLMIKTRKSLLPALAAFVEKEVSCLGLGWLVGWGAGVYNKL